MSELITVPTFVFHQGDKWAEDANSEREIHIDFYKGSVCLRQYDRDNKDEIIISDEHFEPFLKELKKKHGNKCNKLC